MQKRILSIGFISFLVSMLGICIVTPDRSVSESERRNLAQFPSISVKSVMDTTFFQQLNDYCTDQFVFRDVWRGIKAQFSYTLLGKKENNDIYAYDDHILKAQMDTDEKSIDQFVGKVNTVIDKMSENNHVYTMIVPDQNYFVPNDVMPHMDYGLLYEKINDIHGEIIDIRDVLTLDDYYMTDIHWKQENLSDVVSIMAKFMDLKTEVKYEIISCGTFSGGLMGQYALPHEKDELIILNNETIENCDVWYLEDPDETSVYPTKKREAMDPYDLYLNGATALIQIDNPFGPEGRELVMFRDSFGSSLAPLLIDSYSRITIIDMRYIASSVWQEYVDFNTQDVLFIYSTLLVNQSSTLKP